MNCQPNKVADLIPVDTVANALVAIAFQTARCPVPSAPIPVYNITSGNVNPITWEMFLEYGRDIATQMPSMRVVRIPVAVPRGTHVNAFSHHFTRLISETLFAYVMDFLIIMFGHKPL
jgi:fatty acyl-CoA reductase